jgi:hypothetical protein
MKEKSTRMMMTVFVVVGKITEENQKEKHE